MFTIIGGDGREYGPVTADQIRVWMKAGRANLDTKARADGSAEWRRLGEFEDFAPPAAQPPPLDAAPAAGVPPPPPAPANDRPRADRGARLMARIIDWALEFVCAIPGGIVIGTELPELFRIIVDASQGQEPDFSQLNGARIALGVGLILLLSLALLAVQIWMLSVRGQTIGKRLLGIRVVKADGSPCGFVNGWLMRELLITAIGFACSMIPFVGPLLFRPAFHLVDWCLIFRDDERCLHDQIAATKVVKS